MKYVKTFNESEETLIRDLDQLGLESMKGWILALQPWNSDDVENYFYLCITAPNIYAAVEQMMIGVGEDIEIGFWTEATQHEGGITGLCHTNQGVCIGILRKFTSGQANCIADKGRRVGKRLDVFIPVVPVF